MCINILHLTLLMVMDSKLTVYLVCLSLQVTALLLSSVVSGQSKVQNNSLYTKPICPLIVDLREPTKVHYHIKLH